MQYKQAAEGKELDGGMGYSQNGGGSNEGGYSMSGGTADKDGGMGYSMGGGASSHGGMKYTEANEDGKVTLDGYSQNGK